MREVRCCEVAHFHFSDTPPSPHHEKLSTETGTRARRKNHLNPAGKSELTHANTPNIRLKTIFCNNKSIL